MASLSQYSGHAEDHLNTSTSVILALMMRLFTCRLQAVVLVSVLLLVLQYVLNRYHVDAFMKINSENIIIDNFQKAVIKKESPYYT